MAQAYPGVNAEVSGRDYFIDAIDDPDIHWRIYQEKSENLDGAFCAAVEFEAYKSVEKRRITGKRYVQDVNIESENSEKQNMNYAESLLAKLQRQGEELKKKLVQSSKTNEKNVPYSNTKHKREHSSVKCWNCGETGHVQYNCPSNKPVLN